MSNIRLAKCGSLIAQKVKNLDYTTVLCRILTTGNYIDMNGTEVVVDEAVLTKLVTNYNERIEKEFNKHKQLIVESADQLDAGLVTEKQNMILDDFDGLPNQIDHDTSTIRSTVGNVIGKMELKRSMGKMAIFANIKVKGNENVCCVADHRWRNLSVQYNPNTYEWVEVSWVIYGADPDANKIMSLKMSQSNHKNIITGNEKFITLIQECTKARETLNRKIFVDKKLLGLCKLRKITKAESYFIGKELNGIQDLTTLNSIFNILDAQLSAPKKEKFIDLPEKVMSDLHNTLKAVSNGKIY